MLRRWLLRKVGRIARSLDEVQEITSATSKPLVLTIRHPSIKNTPYSFQQVYAKYSAENEAAGMLEGRKEDKLLDGKVEAPADEQKATSGTDSQAISDDPRWTLVTYELQQLSEAASVFGLKKLPAIFLIKLGQIYDCSFIRSGRRRRQRQSEQVFGGPRQAF